MTALRSGSVFGVLTLGAACVAIAIAGAACSDDDPAGTSSSTGADTGGTGAGVHATGVTFHKDVEPILQRSCLGCHREGQIGGFSLIPYKTVQSLAHDIVAKVESGEMPPFLAKSTPECAETRPWVDDRRLPAEDLETLKAWIDNGTPEGDPADAPPPYVAPENGLPNKAMTLTPAQPSVVEGETDQFTCVIYDPALTETQYLDGVNLSPENSTVAHHALIMRAPRADAMAASGGNERFDCFGGIPGDLVHAWVPGAQPLQLPDTIGIRVKPDEVFVVQMHYHPTGSMQTDASSLELRWASEMPTYEYQVALIGAPGATDGLLPGPNDNGSPEFRIPAGATGHTETLQYTIPNLGLSEVKLLQIANHMHYVGVDELVTMERDGQTECMLHTPRWDFNWQMFYQWDLDIDQLPVAKPGDVWTLRCTYDNSMGNPFVVKALNDQGLAAPQDVVLGEQTLDEMCLMGLGFLVPAGLLP
ncbi:MAG: hypothetical protein HOV80_20445 [Polyangiaceae bacterium]|nr:hypothetical protein [Polyangiaceae bacterium]